MVINLNKKYPFIVTTDHRLQMFTNKHHLNSVLFTSPLEDAIQSHLRLSGR